MRKQILSPEVYAKVHELRAQGLSYRAISRLTGVSDSYCCEIVNQDIHARPEPKFRTPKRTSPQTKRLNAEQIEDIKRRIIGGESYQSIADIYGVPYQTVANYHRRVSTKCEPGEDIGSWYERTAYLHPWVQLGGIPRVGAPVYADPMYYEV